MAQVGDGEGKSGTRIKKREMRRRGERWRALETCVIVKRNKRILQ
jgi:hypothetical protein